MLNRHLETAANRVCVSVTFDRTPNKQIGEKVVKQNIFGDQGMSDEVTDLVTLGHWILCLIYPY
jgi:hypothetical protein